MIELDIEKFQAIPDRYLRQAAEQNETIRLFQFGEPVAEVRPLPGILKPRPPMQFGTAQGLGTILPGCFDLLQDDLLNASEGKTA